MLVFYFYLSHAFLDLFFFNKNVFWSPVMKMNVESINRGCLFFITTYSASVAKNKKNENFFKCNASFKYTSSACEREKERKKWNLIMSKSQILVFVLLFLFIIFLWQKIWWSTRQSLWIIPFFQLKCVACLCRHLNITHSCLQHIFEKKSQLQSRIRTSETRMKPGHGKCMELMREKL